MIVSVSVATIWTTPEKPREKDRLSLTNPVDMRAWLNPLTIDDRLDFYNTNATQTQVLYGTQVEVIEEQGDWVKVAIPDQSTSKDKRGYPGWMPKVQLADTTLAGDSGVQAVVKTPTTFLYQSPTERGIELSFVTQLPVIESNDEWTTVSTPEGPQLLLTKDVMIWNGLPQTDENTGQSIVDTGKMFLGLHYLWGGMSAFGYDCSGFAYNMHRAHGILIPRDAGEQSREGRLIETDQLLPGDLLFFAHEEGKGSIHHVGIYIGNNQMIHSPESKKSIEILTLAGTKYEKEHIISRRYW